jgi:hypothetical protein
MKDKARKFFFEKKAEPALREPKDFYSPAMSRMHPGHGRRIKVFCFFSSEKKTFLAFFGEF